MKKAQFFITLFWIALGIFVAVYSYRLGLGTLLAPGPGFFPFCLGCAVFLLGLYKLVREFLSKKGKRSDLSGAEEENLFSSNKNKLLLLTATLFAYSIFLESLGFILTTFFTMALLFRVAGYRKWRLIIPYAAIISAITYFGFTYLGTNFPAGILTHLGLR